MPCRGKDHSMSSVYQNKDLLNRGRCYANCAELHLDCASEPAVIASLCCLNKHLVISARIGSGSSPSLYLICLTMYHLLSCSRLSSGFPPPHSLVLACTYHISFISSLLGSGLPLFPCIRYCMRV